MMARELQQQILACCSERELKALNLKPFRLGDASKKVVDHLDRLSKLAYDADADEFGDEAFAAGRSIP